MLILHARRAYNIAFGKRTHDMLVDRHAAQHRFHHLRRDAAGTQNHRALARRVDHARFDAHLAAAPVEDQRNSAVHILKDMLRGRRARLAAAVGARRGDGPARRRNQRARRLAGRQADADGIQPRAHAVGNPVALGQNQRHRPRPKCVHQLPRRRRNRAHQRRNFIDRRHMDDQRVIPRTPLRLEDFPDGLLIQRIRAQTVHRFRGHADELTLTDELCSLLNRLHRDGLYLCMHPNSFFNQ